MQVLAQVVETRLIDGLREREGLTYSPIVFTDQSLRFPSYGMIAARVEIAPDKTDQFYQELGEIMRDLARTPLTEEELDRARNPVLTAALQGLRTMDRWVDDLVGADEDSRQLDKIRSRTQELASTSPADIQRLAKTYLVGKPPFRLVVRNGAQSVGTGSAPE